MIAGSRLEVEGGNPASLAKLLWEKEGDLLLRYAQ